MTVCGGFGRPGRPADADDLRSIGRCEFEAGDDLRMCGTQARDRYVRRRAVLAIGSVNTYLRPECKVRVIAVAPVVWLVGCEPPKTVKAVREAPVGLDP